MVWISDPSVFKALDSPDLEELLVELPALGEDVELGAVLAPTADVLATVDDVVEPRVVWLEASSEPCACCTAAACKWATAS